MVDLPTFSDHGESTVESIQQAGRSLIPWLSDPPQCENCGALLYASESFDPREAAIVASWECRECDAGDRYREPEYGSGFVEGPSEGSGLVREWLEGWE